MVKELQITVKINTEFIVNSNPKLEDWVEASEESKKYYVKEQVKNYIIEKTKRW